MTIRRVLFMPTVLLLVASLAILPALAGGMATDGRARETQALDNRAAIQRAIQSGEQVRVMVELSDPAIAASQSPAVGRLDLSSSAVRSYAAQLAQRQDAFLSRLAAAVPSARVQARYAIVFNGFAMILSGRDLPALLRLEGVRAVTVVRKFRPVMNVSLPLINAPALWLALGGHENAGAGIRIGIIDTGIDIRNPFFDDTGYAAPPGFPKSDNPGNRAYTNDKVIVARAYPSPGGPDDAKDTNGHGSHVGGTAGGNHGTVATLLGVKFRLSGVAPRAHLGNYNVFPNEQGSADDPEIIAAIEDAVRDGMDVINESLGGPVTVPERSDPLAVANNNAVRAGVVAAIAAGNSGPGASTITSPGIARRAITAGASTNPHFLGQPVRVTAPTPVPPELTNIGAATGQFKVFKSTIEANYVWWGAIASDDLACTPVSGKPVDGKIALISRGTCTFTTKIRNAENAGAIATIIFNNVAGDPIAMAHDGTDPFPTIPAVMVDRNNGLAMRDWYQAHPATAKAKGEPKTDEFVTENADIIAGFSSRGPTMFDLYLKPDVTAPGVNVLSAVNAPDGFAFFQGTSMATPHVAGSAALLRQLNPTWAPQQIKSALITTAHQPVFDNLTGTAPTGVMVRGGGRVNLRRAMDPRATFDPASLSFGLLAPGGRDRMVIRAVGVGGGGNWDVLVTGPFRPDGSPAAGVTVTVRPNSLSLAAGSTADIRVVVRADVTALGEYEGDIVLRGTRILRIPYWVKVGTP